MRHDPSKVLTFGHEPPKPDTPRREVSKFEAVKYRIVREGVHEWTFNVRNLDTEEVTLSEVLDKAREVTDKPDAIGQVFKIWQSGASKSQAQKAMKGVLGQKYVEQVYKVFNAARAEKGDKNGNHKPK